jgi:hypothetical protein
MDRRLGPIMLVNFVITMFFAYTGPERLEPLILSWFWGPVIAFALADRQGDAFLLPKWTWHNRLSSFCIYLATLLALSAIFWRYLYWLDVNLIHPFREAFSHWVGMDGQSGFFLIGGIVLSILAGWHIAHDLKHGHRYDVANDLNYDKAR